MAKLPLPYRPDVDGLRFVAVAAVIASHLPEHFLPGGFLGVDVFFVISGFVVTASLMGQKRTALPQLYAGFLSRRVRRLLPALATCVLLTGAVVLAADPFPTASIQTGLGALFGVGNIVLFFQELDYFSPSSLFNAFTHTWSLGVEEQFYVVFPLFVWLFYFWRWKTSYKPLGLAMVVGGLISLAIFAGLHENHRAAAFFLMPARIWELGVGALVFLSRGSPVTAGIRPWLQRLSPLILLVLVACFMLPERYHLPATVVAVILTGVLLAAGRNAHSARVLSWPPFVYGGKISYSLYLWHWPAIALGPIILPVAWRNSAVYVVAAILAAVISYHCVENPLRYRKWSGRQVGDIVRGALGSALVGVVLVATSAILSRSASTTAAALHPPAYLPLMHSGKSHKQTCVLDGGSRTLQPDTVDNCTVAPEPGSGMPTIWTMGDSHSGHLQGMLYDLHERLGVGVHLVETPGWPFPLEPATRFQPREELFSRIRPLMKRGDIVLIARIYVSRSEPNTVNEIRPWLYKAGQLAAELADMGVTLIIAGPPPIFTFRDVRECSIEERETCRVERAALSPLVDQVTGLLRQLESEHPNVIIFDTFDVFCPASQEFCYPDNGSIFLFRDRDHFNSVGARLLTGPFVTLLRSSGALTPAANRSADP